MAEEVSSIGKVFQFVGTDIETVGKATGDFMFYLLVFVCVAGILGIIIWQIIDKKTFNKNISTFGVRDGHTIPKGVFKAREIMIPNTSIKVFQLKNKTILPLPTIETGKNAYLFFIRDDNEWINFGLENMNEELKRLKLNYNHVDMRYANSELGNLIDSNYGQSNFWKEYMPWIMSIGFVIIIGIAVYLGADKFAEAAFINSESTEVMAAAMRDFADKTATSGIKGV